VVDADLSFVRRSLRQTPGGSEALQAPTQLLPSLWALKDPYAILKVNFSPILGGGWFLDDLPEKRGYR
jgi:hypothetical protein